MKTKRYRMKYSTYIKLRRNFKPLSRKETASSYFERLSKALEFKEAKQIIVDCTNKNLDEINRKLEYFNNIKMKGGFKQ